MIIKDWNPEPITGYKPKTTFYQDFSIADNFGTAAVKDTFNRAFKEWKTNHVYLTELVMVLNWKIREHFGHNEDLANLYNDLWHRPTRGRAIISPATNWHISTTRPIDHQGGKFLLPVCFFFLTYLT